MRRRPSTRTQHGRRQGVKTAAQWVDEGKPLAKDWIQFIASIQHDAQRQGLTDAADLLNRCNPKTRKDRMLRDRFVRVILTARDSLTKP